MNSISLGKLENADLDTVFRTARTHSSFSSEPIEQSTLREIYELMKFGPTAANTQPLRIVYLTTDEAKARLVPLLGPKNGEKSAAAPVVALLAADADFHDHMAEVFPHAPESRDWFGDLDNRRQVSTFNSALQMAYFIIAARSLGLATGPMNGMNADAVDQEFFAGTNTHAIAVVNLGHPAGEPPFARLPRRAFEDVVTVL
jgi:3-hydroxypropanoate dehydrogenase